MINNQIEDIKWEQRKLTAISRGFLWHSESIEHKMIYFYSTSAISEAKVRKSPDISETNGVTDHRKHKVQFPAPLEAKVIKKNGILERKKQNYGCFLFLRNNSEIMVWNFSTINIWKACIYNKLKKRRKKKGNSFI